MNAQILYINKPALLETEINKQQLAEEPKIQIKANPFIWGLDLAAYYLDLPYSIPEHEFVRIIRIGTLYFQPSEGTHGAYLNQLNNVTLTQFTFKNERLNINYDIA